MCITFFVQQSVTLVSDLPRMERKALARPRLSHHPLPSSGTAAIRLWGFPMFRFLTRSFVLSALAGAALVFSAEGAFAQVQEDDPSIGMFNVRPRDLSTTRTMVRVACWNIAHFVDEFDDPNVSNPQEDRGARRPEVLAKLGEAMRRLDADVLVLLETEGEEWTHRFFKQYAPELGYDTIVSCRVETWHQNVVFCSRVPLGPLTSLKSLRSEIPGMGTEQNRFNNRVAFVEVMPTPNYTFVLGAAHLKAGTDADDRPTRLGMIDTIKWWFARELRRDPELNIVLVGDMNSTEKNPEFQRFVTGTPNLQSLFAPWGFPPTHPAEYPTRHIDMIFANPNMLAELVPESVAVASPFPRSEMSALSDHLPVVATFHCDDKPVPER